MNKFSLSIIAILILSTFTLSAQEKKTEKELIESLIEKKRKFNKKFGYGYRIQLYNGLEVEAKKIQAKFRISYPETKTYLIYQQPEWKIQVGHYRSRLESDRALNSLKKKYPYAIVVPLGK